MRRPDARRGATRYLVMGLLALAGCGREDAPADAAPLGSRSAALESGPDLVVTQVRGPASVWKGQGFTATVKVCNQGTAPAYNWPRVELFLSMDDTLTLPAPGTPPGPSDDQESIGFADLTQSLQPGQCESRSVYAYAGLPPASTGDGAYYLAAAIDTTHVEMEAREDNNVLVSGLMGVGSRADLVVTEVSAPPSVRNGYGFKASVKVCNQGTVPSSGGSYYPYGSSRLELFLSMDTELTLPDPSNPSPSIPMDQTSLGYVELETLSPGQCVKKEVYASTTLPPAATGDGAYYLVAAVDTTRLEQELREDNNVLVSGLVGVGERPDLVVTEVSGPASVRPWQGFTATVKVCNQGTSPTASYSSGARMELFLSADTSVTMPAPGQPPELMPIASVNLDQTLLPGQCVTKRVFASASPPPESTGDGAYYLAAAIDTNHVEQELREDNNVRVGGLMGVGHRSDLVVTQVKGPTSVRPGQGFLATVTVCNQGTYSTNSYYPKARLELYLSMDTELTLPDPYMPYPGMPMDQQVIGELELDTLYEGQCVTRDVYAHPSLPAAAPGDGAYYLAAAIDINHAEQELREDNNVFVSGLMGVGHRSDLVVTDVSAPPSARPGQSFMASVTVCNQGTSPTSGYYSGPRMELFLSTTPELAMPDPSLPYPGSMSQVPLGFMELNQSLNPGQCVTQSVPASAHLPPMAPPDSAYYLGAAVDTSHTEQELREDNNVYVEGLMGVGYRADLVVTELSGPTSVRPGQPFAVTAKVCNQGTSSAYGYSRLDFFLSMDTELTLPGPSMPSSGSADDQAFIGSVDLSQSLAPGQCVNKSVLASAYPPPMAPPDGAFYLAAAVDTNNNELELREDNNVRVGGLMGVGHRSDLVVTELKAPASLSPGQSFLATVKVCNQGTSSTSGYYSGARLELFMSMDTQLTLPEPYMPSPPMPEDQRSIGYVELDPLNEGQCVTKSVYANADLPYAAPSNSAYYLAAAVDTNNNEMELREDNNVLVGGLVGVGYRADLVLTELSAPANLAPGQPFTASVKVCNQGTAPTGSSSYSGMPRVELFLSMDAELTLPGPYMPYMPEDQRSLGYVELSQQLNPGQCVTKSVPASADLPYGAQPDGAYYLAAAADSTQVEPELREDNNVRVSGPVGVGYRADLVVTELSAPASLMPGQGFTSSVKVCNQGTSSTNGYYSPRLELFLSMDTELTLPDPSMPYPGPMDQTPIGYVELNQPLQPGQCVTKSVSANASLPPAAQGDGTYYLAAAIDTNNTEQELREDNNVRVSGPVGVGYRSDLVVTELSVPDSVWPGQSFTASVKVCNQGTGPVNGYSYGPRLELFLSMDTELTLPDPYMPYPSMPMDQTSIGYVELNQYLNAGQCVTKSVYASASLPPAAQGDGAYYLAAAVDSTHMEQELREDNNVRVSGPVGVGYRSDLVVTEVSAPANTMHGQSFTASVKVCNRGTAPTNSGYYGPQVELFLSMDTALTLPEPYMPYPGPATDQVSIGAVELDQPLNPGRCVTKSVPAYAALPPDAMTDGALYLVAAVDTDHAEQELREDNNVLVSGLMGVGYRSDLVVSEVSAPSNLAHGQPFTASVKVCNQGTTPTQGYMGMPRVELFLSMDTELTLPDPSMPYSGMIMDQHSLGYVELNQPLYPGQCVTANVPANAWIPPAAQDDMALYLVAAVDTNRAEQELREDNNVLVSGLVGVGYRPDLVVTRVSGPASMAPGQGFTASVEVCNQGTQPSMGASRLEVFLSMDTEVTPPDPSMPSPGLESEQMPVGSVDLNQQLAPGQCVTTSVPASAQLPYGAQLDGALYLAAIIDTTRMEQELREDNNVLVGGLMGVGYRPDLVVTGVSAPASAGHGESFTTSVTVCNQGTSPTYGGSYYGSAVELFLSTDTELTLPSPTSPSTGMESDQMPIGYVQLEQTLAPGQCVTKSMSASAQLPPDALGDGAYYLVAAVDTNHAEQELREDNNVLVSGLMGVGFRSDLVVTEVSAPASVTHGQSFTASVKVCNQGKSPSYGGSSYGPGVELFLSMDTELTLPSPGSPYPSPGMLMDQQSIGYVELGQPLNPGECVTKDVPAHAALPPAAQPDGAYYLVAAVDTVAMEQELREDNNVHVDGLLGVGYRADLVVTEVSAPASVEHGQPFTASVKVCNQGTTPLQGYAGPSRVELFLSVDATVSMPSTSSPGMPVDQLSIGSVELTEPLAPAQCVTKDVPAYSSLPPMAQGDGAYYLAAAIDTTQAEQELREDNNLLVKGLMGVGSRPDLVVTEVSAPASVQHGQGFTASVKVCNQGTVPSMDTAWLMVMLSTDTQLSLPDPSGPPPADQMKIGSIDVAPLPAGQCVTKDVPAYASLPAGAQAPGVFHLGAIVDVDRWVQELREDNNTLAETSLEVTY
ncbi:hypothetical protein NR798_28275 [Archangium gephyra]|uniref:CARDB domain-containing protein n=1 Tax=Archangium gephyra TaxID=48 RepID=UPI0035D49071